MGDKPKTKFALGDYVEVSERIAAWFEAYPDGRIETELVSMTDKLVVTKSRCYRSADPAEAPAGIGHSMLGIPGKTPYTKDSELENCETSSVGRALVMAGIPSKNIASGHEIRNKRVDEPKAEPIDPARRQRDDAWIADCKRDIEAAATPESLTPILELIQKQNGYVKDAVREAYGKRAKELKPATNAA